MSTISKRPQAALSMRRRRIELCASAAIGALALAVTTAGAQSYNANHVVVAGDAFISDGAGTTDVSLNTTATVIRWDVPAGTGTYQFQPSGTTTTFHYFSDFSVLNVVNIDQGRAIRFDGATVGQVGSATGGNVWFYSPGGMIVGSTASFNVGSLLLSTSTPADQTSTFNSGTVSLTGAPNTASSILVEAGASITANNYIAMVAPRIEQGGTVRAGGEIAYVAAQKADLTFPTGSNLFSILIPGDGGTDAVNGQGQVLVHTGSTGGPGAGANTPNRNIYFVAMPKNTAITTLLGGSVGYDAASGAAVNAEGIDLIAGGVVFNGTPYRNTNFSSLPGNLDDVPANLTITGGASFAQNVTAYATNLSTQAVGGDISFARGATLTGTLTNTLNVATGRQLTSGGTLSFYARGYDNSFNLIGGTLNATVNGTLRVGSGVTGTAGLLLSAESVGAPESDPTGGNVTLTIAGGSLVAGTGGVTLNADGTGGEGFNIEGGDGFGGSAALALQGTLNTGGSVVVTARGVGGNSAASFGGSGTGGTASLTSTPTGAVPTPTIGATVITVAANGTGGSGRCASCGPVGTTGGSGIGGSATISMTDTTVTVPNISAESIGTGGAANQDLFPTVGGSGGAGAGGLATVSFTRGLITSASVGAHADGAGGDGGNSLNGSAGEPSGAGGNGGTGTGGKTAQGKGAAVSLAGSTLSAGEGNTSVLVSANGTGGGGGLSQSAVGGDGGTGSGGDAAFVQSVAAHVNAGVTLQAIGNGSNGGGTSGAGYSRGGDAIGGSASFTATGGGSFAGSLSLYTIAENGFGGGPDIAGIHGSMQGGTSTTAISGTAVTLSDFFSTTTGSSVFEGGDQFQDGPARGGATSLSVSASGSLTVLGSLDVDTSGTELGGRQGATQGTGGAITVRTSGNGSIVTPHATIKAEGQGGFSNVGAGGNGTGGAILIEADGGSIDLGAATVDAAGGAGVGTTGISTGNGGSITINALNGGVFAAGGGLDLDARGTTFSDGNRAVGGSVALTANGGRFTVAGLTARSSGHLQNVGTNTGGSISIVATGAASAGGSSFGDTTLEALGTTTTGTITIRNDTSGGATPLAFGALTATATGTTTNPSIQITSVESPITATSATFNTDTGLSFAALNGGTFSVAGDLTATTGLFITVDGGGSAVPTIQANNLDFSTPFFSGLGTTILKANTDLSIFGTSQVTAQTLTAGNSIFVSSPGNVTIASASVTDPAAAGETTIDESVSRLEIDAGYSDGGPGGPANVTINTAANARGSVLIQATGDILVGSGATIRSDNELRLSAGDDIVVGTGASVAGAFSPLVAGSGFATLVAGDGTGPAEVHSLINGGAITAGDGPLSLRADAIQSTGSLGGRTVTASLLSGSITGDDGGALTASCSAGAICVGAIAATGAVSIGTSGRIPTTTRLTGSITAASLNVRGDSGIFLGGSTPSTMTIGGAASFNAGTQSLNDLGTVTIQAGTIAITAANDIAASTTSFRSSGNILLSVGRNIFAGDLIADGVLGSGHVDLTGQLNVAGRISAGSGGIDFAAPGGITLNRVILADGTPLTLDSGTAALTIADASANNGARASTVTLHGGAITVGKLASSGAVSLSGSGSVQVTTDLAAGPVTVTGAGVSLVSLAGPLTINSATSSADLALTSGGAITLLSGNAAGNTTLTAGNAGLTVANSISSGAFNAQSAGNIGYTSIGAGQASLTAGGTISGGQLIVTGSGTATFLAGGAIVHNGALRANGGISVTGGSVNLTTPSALTLALARATNGDLTLTPAGSLTLTSGSATGKVTINATGNVSLPSLNAGGDVLVNGPSGLNFGTLSGNNVVLRSANASVFGQRLTATGTATLNGATNILVTTDVAAAGGLSLSAPNVALTSLGSLNVLDATATSNAVSITAGGDLTVQRATAPGAVTLISNNGAVSAGSIASGDAVKITAARAIDFSRITGASATITAGGDINGGALALAGKAGLQANGAIRLTGSVVTGTNALPTSAVALAGANERLGNGGDLVVASGGDVLVNDAVAGGRAILSAAGSATIGQLRSGGDLEITAARDLGFTSVAGNAVTLTSTGGAVSGQQLAASYTTQLSAAGLVQVTSLTSADAVTASGRTIALRSPGALTLASLTSGRAMTIDAVGLSINGSLVGASIDLGSQSIAIGSGARIGATGTTTDVTFRNTGTARSFVGTTGSGYSLSAAGLSRVQADSITLVFPQLAGSSTTQPDVVVGDLTLHGSNGTASGTLANLTPAGSFTIRSPGRVQIAGKLQLTDLSSNNSATIEAGQAIDVVTPAGQILLTGSNAAAQGTLTLSAPKVTVSTVQAMADLAGSTSFDQRQTRLAVNDGAAVDQGYIVGGHLVFRVADALYVQNAGGAAPADRRGVTAGTGGIDVFATGSRTPEVILNGRQATVNGGFTGGLALAPLIRYASAQGSVNAGSASAINACTPTTCTAPSPMNQAFQYVLMLVPPQDLENLLDLASEQDTAQTLPDVTRPLIQDPPSTPFSYVPVVDEPVTGVGTETVGGVDGPTGNEGSGGPGGAPGNSSFSTGPDNANVGTGPENANVGTGPENGGTGGQAGNGGNRPPAGTVGNGPQNGNIGTGTEDRSGRTGPDGGRRGPAPQNPDGNTRPQEGDVGNATQNGGLGTGPQNDAVGTGPERTPEG